MGRKGPHGLTTRMTVDLAQSLLGVFEVTQEGDGGYAAECLSEDTFTRAQAGRAYLVTFGSAP